MSAKPIAATFERTNVKYGPLASAWRSPFSGWRGGLARWTAGATLVLVLNIAIAIVAGDSWKPIEGIATAYTGDCKFVSRLDKGLHLIVDLLSTLLLGASNYCMQRLVAPTRQEIDAAHARKKSLDIGIPGLRNLESISGLRLGLWFLSGISSVPLHFVYNSVLFETQGKLIIEFALVDPTFFTQQASSDGFGIKQWQNHLLNDQYLNTSLWENLTSDECITRYTAPTLLDIGDGFGVPTLKHRNTHGLNDTPSSSWRLFNYWKTNRLTTDEDGDIITYEYCVSQKVPRQPCRLQFSQTILYFVIACNIGKVAAMIAMLQKLDHNTIVTVGDAMESFIRAPDTTTKDCCLLPKEDIAKAWNTPLESWHGVVCQKQKRVPWYTAASWRRWIISLLLYITTLCIAIGLYTRTKPYCDQNGHCSANGFGNFDLNFTVNLDILVNYNSVNIPILLANLPQAIIAFIYLTYNGLFTTMLANREWTQYSVKRALLRVTNPSPSQRSTYFLSQPYTFSIPLQLAFTALHWLVSQSVFLARVENLEVHQ